MHSSRVCLACFRKSEETRGAGARRGRATACVEVTGGWILAILVGLCKNHSFYSMEWWNLNDISKGSLWLLGWEKWACCKWTRMEKVGMMRNEWKWDDAVLYSVGCGGSEVHLRQEGIKYHIWKMVETVRVHYKKGKTGKLLEVEIPFSLGYVIIMFMWYCSGYISGSIIDNWWN